MNRREMFEIENIGNRARDLEGERGEEVLHWWVECSVEGIHESLLYF